MTAKVYRDYDQAALDGQLNLRARWPEHGEYFARWAEESAEVRRRLGGRIDLPYGPSDGQKLDLFVPAESKRAPLLAFIHGGYWQSLDKGDFSYLAAPYVASGIAFASLNYDLAPAVSVEEIVAQIRRALISLYGNAGDLGIDPGRLYVCGHSAGGHLTAMAMATDWPAEAGLPADLVKGGCSLSGVYDLEPLRLSYHQAVLKLDSEMARRMTPLGDMPGSAGPLILAVGSEETEEFLRQQDEYAAAWRRAGLALQVVDLPGRNHFSAVDALCETDHPLFAAVSALVLQTAPP